MGKCMCWLSRIDEAYTFHSQSVVMASALQMDKDDPNETDPVKIEFRKRIWTLVCSREIYFRLLFDKPPLIPLDTISKSPKPTLNSNDTKMYKLSLVRFLTATVYYVGFLKISDIDWSLPDVMVAQQLVSIASFLQRDLSEYIHYIGEDHLEIRLAYGINSNLWPHWCAVWRQFIQSEAPSRRFETDLMKNLRAKGFDEFVKGLNNCILSLQEAIRRKCWCREYPTIGPQLICENSKFISRIHPDPIVRRSIFQNLVQTLRLTQSSEDKGVIEQWIAHTLVGALEEMKPAVFSKEELERMSKPKPRPLAKKQNAG
ncbi:uncharacterized protein VTP21DRAFT_5646 [Calcarisporiella thermophila]|uniref:uncharacterized protein n=1 Tax=Calcarisporiella thermophila TaxID=911321 RepID=UPI003743D936